VAVDELRYLVASLHTAERGARDAAPRDQEPRHHIQRLAPAGDAADGREAPAHARRFDGLAHHRDEARRLEGVVRAEAAGHFDDLLDDLGPAGDGVMGALAACEVESPLGRIDADDPPRTAEPATGYGAEPHQACAENDARRTGLDLCGVESRTEPGREA